jgi:hypothetical protein
MSPAMVAAAAVAGHLVDVRQFFAAGTIDKMEPFNSVTGIAAPMMAANIDTDVIMPKQFLKGIDRSGLDKGAFYDHVG